MNRKELILSFKKLYRFTKIYGFSRAYNKSIARLRTNKVRRIYLKKDALNVGLIGCGQFAFSCILFFLSKNKGKIVNSCFDIDADKMLSLANYYKIKSCSSASEVFENKAIQIIYIASNHASHTDYAIQALKNGINKIYIEKPISVNHNQFQKLLAAKEKYNATLYSGYNRPYSKAIKILRNTIEEKSLDENNAFSLNYFISGHLISQDHWYRNPEEGTRICGNMGHWLDLTIHVLNWRCLPEYFNILITYSNLLEPDDNITITLTSNLGDLISIMLTSRTEPFEGINETLNFQYSNTIAKIDDFRQITIWKDSTLIKKKFRIKDVGHERAILQPFKNDNRNWAEVEISTLLMLHITKMVQSKEKESVFSFNTL